MASSATQNASRRESHSYSSSSRSFGRRRASARLLSAFSLPSRSFSKARQQANACFTFPNILGRRRRSDTVVVAAGGERGSADSLFDMPGFSDVSSLSLSLSLSFFELNVFFSTFFWFPKQLFHFLSPILSTPLVPLSCQRWTDRWSVCSSTWKHKCLSRESGKEVQAGRTGERTQRRRSCRVEAFAKATTQRVSPCMAGVVEETCLLCSHTIRRLRPQ